KNILFILLSFITRKVFLAYIGVQYLGITGLFSNILSLLSMADLGFGTAMNFSFYRPLAENDTDKLAALVRFYGKVYLAIASAITLIGLALAPFIGEIVNLEEPVPHLTVYYLLFLCDTVMSYLFVYKSAVISADQKHYILDTCSMIIQMAKLCLQCVEIIVFQSYFAYIMIGIVATLAYNLCVSHKADRLYPFIKKKCALNKGELWFIFDNLKSVFLYKISGSMLNGIDNIVISTFLGTIAVGIYSNYLMVTASLTSFITIVFTSMTASIGNLILKESPERRFSVFRLTQHVSFWISGFVSVCTYLLISDFIFLCFGKEYVLNSAMSAAVALNLYFSTSMQPIWIYREATGLYRKTKYIMLVASGINLVSSVFLAKTCGVAGVIFATVFSKFATYFWYEPKILYQSYFHKKVRTYYFDHAANLGLVIACGLILTKLFSVFEHITVANWLLKAVIAGASINMIYLLINIRNGSLAKIIKKLKTAF
ncbi:MAG: hypothetical protein K2P59_01745, partial [Acetatifactor sp.]|nr:hypothetical protein [Acetatifactor sp.]